jgi:hypothetical protein
MVIGMTQAIDLMLEMIWSRDNASRACVRNVCDMRRRNDRRARGATRETGFCGGG